MPFFPIKFALTSLWLIEWNFSRFYLKSLLFFSTLFPWMFAVAVVQVNIFLELQVFQLDIFGGLAIIGIFRWSKNRVSTRSWKSHTCSQKSIKISFPINPFFNFKKMNPKFLSFALILMNLLKESIWNFPFLNALFYVTKLCFFFLNYIITLSFFGQTCHLMNQWRI